MGYFCSACLITLALAHPNVTRRPATLATRRSLMSPAKHNRHSPFFSSSRRSVRVLEGGGATEGTSSTGKEPSLSRISGSKNTTFSARTAEALYSLRGRVTDRIGEARRYAKVVSEKVCESLIISRDTKIVDTIDTFLAKHWRRLMVWGVVYMSASPMLAHISGQRYTIAAKVFLQALSTAYLMAFVSMRSQVIGLVGEKGIISAKNNVEGWKRDYNLRNSYPSTVHDLAENVANKVLKLQNFLWDVFKPSDTGLRRLCNSGIILSMLTFMAPFYYTRYLQYASPIMYTLLWAMYRNIIDSTGVFTNLQWDILLIETGAVAPLLSFPGASPFSSTVMLWTLRALVFKVMFASGVVKLESGCPKWRTLSAMDYHYETQPLPHKLSWYAHGSPKWMQTYSALGTFMLEIFLPFLYLTPLKSLSRTGFLGTSGLMASIILTGNYGFFNWLTAAISLSLLSDSQFPSLPTNVASILKTQQVPVPSFIRNVHLATALFLYLPFYASIMKPVLRLKNPRAPGKFFPDYISHLANGMRPLGLGNHYGLFARMTTFRWELIIEGSNDRKNWKEYLFRYKPSGPVTRPPVFCPIGHMPRLDWMSWFIPLRLAAGGEIPQWYQSFMKRVLEGSESVISLMKHNPFPSSPPRYLRLSLYDYHLSSGSDETSSKSRDTQKVNKTGEFEWWCREKMDDLCTVELRNGRLSLVS